MAKWEQDGLQKGPEEGWNEGWEDWKKGWKEGWREGWREGIREAQEIQRTVLRDLATQVVSSRFGKVPPRIAERIQAMDSDQLQPFIIGAMSARKLADLER